MSTHAAQIFGLSLSDTYLVAFKQLAQLRSPRLQELIRFIQAVLPAEVADDLIGSLMRYSKDVLKDSKQAEEFVGLFSEDRGKVEALISLGKLKNAYLMAVKARDARGLVVLIKQAASKAANTAIASMCDSYLKDNVK